MSGERTLTLVALFCSQIVLGVQINNSLVVFPQLDQMMVKLQARARGWLTRSRLSKRKEAAVIIQVGLVLVW